jgi:hypothetical protein
VELPEERRLHPQQTYREEQRELFRALGQLRIAWTE